MLHLVFILIAVFTAFTAGFAVTSLRERERRAGALGLLAALALAGVLAAYGWAWRAGWLASGAAYAAVTVVGVLLTAGTAACFAPFGRNPKALAGTRGMLEGEPERFNQKDTAFNIAHIGAYGEEVSRQRWALQSRDPFGGIYWTMVMGLRNSVDGKVAAERPADQSPARLTRLVKRTAKYVGADLVGVTTVKDHFTYSESFSYEQTQLGVGPAVTTPVEQKHKYVICLAKEMSFDRIRHTLTDRNDQSLGEVGKTYYELARIACALAAYIRQLGWSARAHHVRNEQLFQVPHAIDAGLGEQGRLNYLITRQFGPRVRLASVTTDMPLLEDAPVDIGVQDFCENCRLCEINCPSQALAADRAVVRGYRKWPQDQAKCFLFWVTGGNTFGCTMCLKVCPWNKPRAFVHRVAFVAAARSKLARRLLYAITVIFYGRRTKWRRRPLPDEADMPPETKSWGR